MHSVNIPIYINIKTYEMVTSPHLLELTIKKKMADEHFYQNTSRFASRLKR
jgi:hypothetical protein